MDTKELLKNSCHELGVSLDDTQINQFFKYKDLLLSWNEKMNLTAITDEKDVIIKHFADSVSLCAGADLDREISVIDVGTGAGFPGVPVKIAFPKIHITLLDSLNKRIGFLEEVTKELGLTNVTCVHARAEDGGQDKNLRESFDMCISRAVADLSVLAEYCLPFVKVGGEFISLKGPNAEEEVDNAKTAIKKLGGKVIKIRKITIPNSDITHSLIIIKKFQQTPTAYPRKAGKIGKNPIK